MSQRNASEKGEKHATRLFKTYILPSAALINYPVAKYREVKPSWKVNAARTRTIQGN